MTNEPRFTPAERLISLSLRHTPGMTADELAVECSLNRQYILRLLRVLVLTGKVILKDGRYALVNEVQ